MSEASEGIRGTALGVVVERYEKPRFRRLTGATEQMRELCELLEGHGYTATVLADPQWNAIGAPVREWAVDWGRGGRNGPAVVMWSGHGVLDDGELRLALCDTENAEYEGETFSATELTAAALLGRADQVLLLIDTCHAGAGVWESLQKALNKLSAKNLPPGRSAWLGVIASCRPQEEAEAAGILLDSFGRLLRDGPQTDAYRHEWSRRNEQISGSTVIKTLLTQWPEEVGHRPLEAMTGRDLPMFANPLRRAAPEPELVEHLVQAARGAARTDEGWFFSGRRRVLGDIVEWMGTGQPGLFLVTGSAGSGKSAVLGRIATLSDREHRASIVAHRPLTKEDPDPGEGSVHVSLHLRGFTVQHLAEAIARRLNVDPPQTPAALIDEVERGWPGAPAHLVLVLDGLDEAAPEQDFAIIEQLLAPLSRLACVLLGSRGRSFRPQGDLREPLDQVVNRLVDARARTTDLDDEAGTERDIEEYCRRRLARELPPGDAATVASGIAQRAAPHDGSFLFARMATDSVIRHLSSSGNEDRNWEAAIPLSISAAFTEDLRSGPQRKRDGELLPSAAEDLLMALAWSVGNGMPAQGVWEAAASALGPDGVTYGPEDVDWLLNTYGRYVVEDSDGVQAVYRLYHREFVAHLRMRGEPSDPAYRVARALVDLLRAQSEGTTVLENANPYLCRTLSAHAAEAGNEGVILIRELVDVAGEAFQPDLADALRGVAVMLSSAGRREEALASSQEAADLYRTLAQASPAAHLPDLAGSLNNLAVHQAETGDRNGALTTITEAVTIRRSLAQASPAAYLPNLAMSLTNLATQQAETGDRNGALTTITEATDLYRTLAQASPAAHLPHLAMSLNNLANRQAETGDRNGALTTITEATDLYRTLAQASPAAQLPHLASSLNNLANHQAAAGDRNGALTTITEATNLYRTLAQASPAAHLPNLAMALNNLATQQAAAGDRNGALTTITEATDLYRTLAQASPAAYLPDLAGSLNNLANHQAAAGDRNGALTTITEATDLYRTLAQASPAAYLANLAMSLTNLAVHQAAAGDRNGALTTITEATDLYRALAQASPAAHLPNLAMSLNNLANHQAETGDRNGALTTITEAVTIRRSLAQASPAAHLPHLALSLNNLANHQAETGERNGALTTITEAVTICRALAQASPAAHLPDLAMSLNNLANRQAEAGDRNGALTTITEATNLYRTLAQASPAAHLPDLAGSLNNLANYQAEAGDRNGALTTITEATGLYRALAQASPAAHLPNLAMSLNNLANHQAEAGDRNGALTTITEATNLYRTLAQASPAAHLPNLATCLTNLAGLAPAHDAVAAYSAAEELLSAHPQASRHLAVQRAGLELASIDAELGIRSLIALAAAPQVSGTTDPAAFSAILRLRAHHQADEAHTAQVMTQWCNETGSEPPPWLALPQAALDLAAAWIRCTTWADSCAFWNDHADSLRSAETTLALQTLTLVTPAADQHLQIAREAAATGPDTAFRPYLTAELLDTWTKLPNWQESQAYLADHEAALLHDQALAILESDTETADSALHFALITLARADGIPTAYEYVESRSALHDRLQQLLRAPAAEPGLLKAVALLEAVVYQERFTAAAHLGVAGALDGTPPDLTTPWPPSEPADRDRVIAEIATLMGIQPRHAPALSALIPSILAASAAP